MDKRFFLFMIKGLLIRVPMINGLYRRRGHTGGTDSAEYCLNIWLSHLNSLLMAGVYQYPRTLLEYGPGDSVGVGLAFLLMGGQRYYAIDYLPYANTERNLFIMNELISLLKSSDLFLKYPAIRNLLSESDQAGFINSTRIDLLSKSVQENDGHYFLNIVSEKGSSIPNVIGSVDFIISQAVLEHAKDVDMIHGDSYKMLTPDGYISHKIDHRSHTMSDWWNGHWQYSDAVWRFACSRRAFTINRYTSTEHIEKIKAAGFQIVRIETTQEKNGLPISKFNKTFQTMTLEDYQTSGTYILAKKPVGKNNSK